MAVELGQFFLPLPTRRHIRLDQRLLVYRKLGCLCRIYVVNNPALRCFFSTKLEHKVMADFAMITFSLQSNNLLLSLL